MKLFSAHQIRDWDQYTISHLPISSWELMEKASNSFVEWFVLQYPELSYPIHILCGTGNNGGDGLAIARLLHNRNYLVQVHICQISNKISDDFNKNLDLLPDKGKILKDTISENAPFPLFGQKSLLIDAMLGSGLSRPISGFWGSFFEYINQLDGEVISVDIPSGLFCDQNSLGIAIHATQTFSFETPKLSFLLPENQKKVPRFVYQSIGLDKNYSQQTPCKYHYLELQDIAHLLKKREKFSHKGTFGHALLLVGSSGMAGAAILSAKACLRSGVGLLTIHSSQINHSILQSCIPEAIVSTDHQSTHISFVKHLEKHQAIGIGCGIGKHDDTQRLLLNVLNKSQKPLILDADAINIIAENPEWLELIPANSILTPHPKEFERLFGKSENDFSRLDVLSDKAQKWHLNIVLKGAHSVIATPDGNLYFNSTGNSGMATAGSGDVLTGILTGLLAQGYPPDVATFLGVFLHGLAGDLALETQEPESLIASDIISYLPKAFKRLKKVLEQ